jgi:CRP-like cAMP-binding protein
MTAMAALDQKFDHVIQMLVPVSGLSPLRQRQLLAQGEVLYFGAGEFVFREGDRDDFAFFLLDGQLDLLAKGQLVKKMTGGTPDAVHPLAQLQPRQLTAQVRSPVAVLRLDRLLLDKLLAIDGTNDIEDVKVSEIETEESGDWMTRMLQSELFSRVPAANIQRIFTRLESQEVQDGEVIIEQDAPGDYYYIVQRGRCEVTRRAAKGKVSVKLAELGPGDSFGEEALVATAQRNATVRMLSSGELMRLTKHDFIELISTPLLSAVDYERGKMLVEQESAQWLDCRFPEEHANGSIVGSINQPLSSLRMRAPSLDKSKTYLIYCDTGSRSSVASFLLSERGFDVHYLRGGLAEYGILSVVEQEFTTEPSDADLAVTGDGDDHGAPLITVAALVPASHQSEVEQTHTGVRARAAAIETSELIDADVRSQALKAELAKANIQFEQARKLKEQAEVANRRARESAMKEIKAEKARLAGEARKAKDALAQAKALKKQLEKGKQEADAEAARLRQQELEELEHANQQVEEARRQKAEAEAAKRAVEREAEERVKAEQEKRAAAARRAEETWAETQRLKEELEAANLHAEEEAERLRREQEANIEAMKAEGERRLEEEQKKLEQSYARQADELARLQAMKEAAEHQLEEERERLKTVSSEAKEKLSEAKRIQQEVEQARVESAREAEQRQQRQLELEEQLRSKANAQIVSERRSLEAEFARNAEELDRAQREKMAAEAARIAAADEAERIIKEYKESHELLRDREEQKLVDDRARLEAEAESLRAQMEAAQREKEQALAAQRQTEQQLEAFREETKSWSATDTGQFRVDTGLANIREEIERARANVETAERIERDVAAATDVNQEHLDQQRQEEESTKDRFESEIEKWLREQQEADGNDLQQQILANQKAHLIRIKERAQMAREAAKAHDQALIEELSHRLKEDGS